MKNREVASQEEHLKVILNLVVEFRIPLIHIKKLQITHNEKYNQ